MADLKDIITGITPGDYKLDDGTHARVLKLQIGNEKKYLQVTASGKNHEYEILDSFDDIKLVTDKAVEDFIKLQKNKSNSSYNSLFGLLEDLTDFKALQDYADLVALKLGSAATKEQDKDAADKNCRIYQVDNGVVANYYFATGDKDNFETRFFLIGADGSLEKKDVADVPVNDMTDVTIPMMYAFDTSSPAVAAIKFLKQATLGKDGVNAYVNAYNLHRNLNNIVGDDGKKLNLAAHVNHNHYGEGVGERIQGLIKNGVNVDFESLPPFFERAYKAAGGRGGNLFNQVIESSGEIFQVLDKNPIGKYGSSFVVGSPVIAMTGIGGIIEQLTGGNKLISTFVHAGLSILAGNFIKGVGMDLFAAAFADPEKVRDAKDNGRNARDALGANGDKDKTKVDGGGYTKMNGVPQQPFKALEFSL